MHIDNILLTLPYSLVQAGLFTKPGDELTPCTKHSIADLARCTCLPGELYLKFKYTHNLGFAQLYNRKLKPKQHFL